MFQVEAMRWKHFRNLRILLWVIVTLGLPVIATRAAAVSYDSIWVAPQSDQTRGMVLGDYDGDYDLDLLVVNSGYTRLYRYDGGAAFTLVWSSPAAQSSYSADFGDYDNDGDMDILVGNVGFFNVIYRNDGGSFNFSWTSAMSEQTLSVSWVDFDNDGDLDISAGNSNEPNTICRNNGDGTFTQVWASPDSMFTKKIAWDDFDGDGDPDMLVGNYNQANQVFRNDGGGTFTLFWSSPEIENTTSIEWGDYDGDGDPDIVVGNYSQKNRIYRNDSGVFTPAWQADEDGFYTSFIHLGDMDADGDMDLLSSNFGQANHVHMRNAGSLSLNWSSPEMENSYAAAWWDYDKDGDLDHVVGNDAQSNRIYRNNTNPLNNAPASPVLNARPDTQPGLIDLSWSAVSDDTTPTALITYQIQIGTQSGQYRIVTGPYQGYPGNVGATTTYRINLSAGTYFWRAASLDTSGLMSTWSPEGSFTVDAAAPTITDNQTGDDVWHNTSPGAVYDVDFFDTGGSQLYSAEYTVYEASDRGGTQLLPWTVIASSIGTATYTAGWGLNFAGLPEGVSYVTVRTTDGAGNISAVATDVFYIKKDMSPPDNPTGGAAWADSARTLELANGGWSATPAPMFTWAAAADNPPAGSAGVNSYIIYFGLDENGTPDTATSGTEWTSTSTLVSGSTYFLRISTRDYAGNATGATTLFTYNYDADAPTTPSVSAWDSSLMASALTTHNVYDYAKPRFVWAAAADLPAGPSNSGTMRYWIYFGTNSSGIPDTATTALSWTVDSDLQSSTTYFFRVSAEDTAGNISPPASFAYGYSTDDTDPPSIIDNQPDASVWLNQNTLLYNVDFADTGGSLLQTLQANACSTNANCSDLSVWATITTGLAAASYETDWALPAILWDALPNGIAYISARAWDGAGNVIQSGPLFTILKDTTAPACAVSTPAATQSTHFTATFADTDTGGSGLSLCEYRVQSLDATWTTTRNWTARPCNSSATISVGASSDCRNQNPGSCRISARAYDSASNISSEASALVSINWTLPDTDPPLVSLATPAQGQAISGFVSVTGSVQAADLASWRLDYGPGAAPSRWVSIASGNSPMNNQVLANWDSSLLAGSYTLRLTAADATGNNAETSVTLSITNVIQASGYIPAYRWTLVGISGDPGSASTTTIFGPGEYKVYFWDPSAYDDPYIRKYRFPSSPRAGQCLWIKSFHGEMTYRYSAALVPNSDDFIVNLKQGWNLFALPFSEAAQISQIFIGDAGQSWPLEQAASRGSVSSVLIRYDGSSWVLVDADDSLQPWQGYGIYAYADVDLIIRPKILSTAGAARKVRRVADFDLRISATTRNAVDRDNRMLSVSGAAQDCDAMDVPEPPVSPEQGFVSLRFLPRSGLCAQSGLAADSRPLLRIGRTETWPMAVSTNQAGETVTLQWNNHNLPLDRFLFTLIHVNASQRIDMGKNNAYSFTAQGQDTGDQFRIEVVRLETGLETKQITLQPGWNLISIPLEPAVEDAVAQLGADLPLLNVFQFFDGQFYDTANADIQAGIGYWIYVAAGAEIGFTGVSLDANQAVTIPLKPGWNIIGNPFEASLPWNDGISLSCNGSLFTLTQAIANGSIDSNLYAFDGTGYINAIQLEPWKGYFLKATNDCDLVLGQ